MLRRKWQKKVVVWRKPARKQLESKLGRSVITKDKASDYLLPEKNEQEEKDGSQ